MNKLHDVVQILKAAGWKDNCDAQWSGIEAALPKLAALLSCNSPAEPVARDVLMDALNEVKQTIHDAIDGVDLSAIADRYAAQSPAVPDGYALVPIEPTKAMCEAGDRADADMLTVQLIYRAMIDIDWRESLTARPEGV